MYRSKNILIFFVKKEAVELICSLYSLSVFICYRHGRASKTNFQRSSVAKMYQCTVGISDFTMLVSWNGIEDLNKTLIAGQCVLVLYFLISRKISILYCNGNANSNKDKPINSKRIDIPNWNMTRNEK